MSRSARIARSAAGVLLGLIFSVSGCRSGAAGSVPAPSGTARAGWGIDACLTVHVDAAGRAAYLEMLADTPIRHLREREPYPRMRELADSGARVVAFATLSDPKPRDPRNELPEDLLAVFRAAREMALAHPYVSAWEIACEADVGYVRDLPDRFAAYHKAVYLGIKSSGTRAAVLMGAMALPPGPWLQRAADNGLLDYTDAYNFHFYGAAGELGGVIRAHREFLRRAGRPMPLWITEAGFNAVRPDDFLNAERRRIQAAFTVDTAKAALAAPDVAMFMPFILVHDGDPDALTLHGPANSAGPDRTIRPLPAWDAYVRFARENPWPDRPMVRRAADPNPVVVQWMPAPGIEPHKVGGAYIFPARGVIPGEILVYNFSTEPVRGRLEISGVANAPHGATAGGPTTPNARIVREGGGQLQVEPMSVATIPVSFQRRIQTSFFRDAVTAEFIDTAGRRSPARFAISAWPLAGEFALSAFPAPRSGNPRDARWQATDDLVVAPLAAAPGQPGRIRVHATRVDNDPMQPAHARIPIGPLPREGFVHLKLSRPMNREFKVRVDLIDSAGQRFTIWENLGINYGRPADAAWLNLEDFHNYFWGRTTDDPVFRPDRVRELQLRFYFARANDPVELEVGLAVPRSDM